MSALNHKHKQNGVRLKQLAGGSPTRLCKPERRTAYHTCIRNVTHRYARACKGDHRAGRDQEEAEQRICAYLRSHRTRHWKGGMKTRPNVRTSPVTTGKMNDYVFTLQSLRGRQAFRECKRERLQCGVALQPWPRRHLLPAVRPRWQDVPHRP